MNNPYPTKQQLEREDSMSEAQDILGVYDSAKCDLVQLLKNLHRAKCPIGDVAKAGIDSMWGILASTFIGLTGNISHTICRVTEAIVDESPDGAKEAIDDHFAAYLEQVRALAAGEA